MRDVVILFVHLIVVSHPARLWLLVVARSNLIVPAEFPSLTLGTGNGRAKISATHSAEKVKANRPDLPDLPIKGLVEKAK